MYGITYKKRVNHVKPIFSFYTSADFGRVYHFLRSKELNDYLPYERVRFQFNFGNHWLEGGFERTCGLWEDESGIVSLVLTEGGSRWEESFFIFRTENDKSNDLMGRMCDFAERFTSKVSDDRKSNSYSLCVIDDDKILSGFLSERGYKKTANPGRTLIKVYPAEPEEVVLPNGFTIGDARTVSPFYHALAHIHSFRYNQDDDSRKKGFTKIRTMPDYRPDLDLIMFDSERQPAAFANFWISEKSKTAYIEPMGTVWWYRRMGLGKALITEGINRTRNYGCVQIIPAGGDQPFYWNLGFEPQNSHDFFWSWSSK